MPLDVVRRLSHQRGIVAQAAYAGVAGRAQQVSNLACHVVVVDIQGSLTGRPTTNCAHTVLSRELRAVIGERNPVQALAERIPVATAPTANPGPRRPANLPVRVLLVKGVPALAMCLCIAPVRLHSDRRSFLSASSKCFFSSVDVMRV